MELKIVENSMLTRIGSEEIGNNGRLDIMLDTSSGLVWADECHGNSWSQYDDEDIICVGNAKNEYGKDEDGEDLDYLMWTIEIYAPENESEFLYGDGDYAIDVDEILETIAGLYKTTRSIK